MFKLNWKLSIIGLVLLLFLLISANSVTAEVGVTEDSVLVGCSNSFSGPLVYPGTQLVNNGLEAYFGYINDEGGINGRKIKEIAPIGTSLSLGTRYGCRLANRSCSS